MKRLFWLAAGAGCCVVVLLWIGRWWQGPVVFGYQVQQQPLVQTLVASGRVDAFARVQIGSPITGVLLARNVSEGASVAPGEVLATLRAEDLSAAVDEAAAAVAELQQSSRPQAQVALREAQTRLEQISRETQRRKALQAKQLLAAEAVEQAIQAETLARIAVEQAQLVAKSLASGKAKEAAALARLASAKAQLDKTNIRTQVAGRVLTRNAEPGDLIQPGRVLFEIARIGAPEVILQLDEKNLALLKLGQTATCIADAYPATPFTAQVDFIAPGVDAQKGTVEVRLSLNSAPNFLREGMTVSVNIETGRRQQALVVINSALTTLEGTSTQDGKNAQVWVVSHGKLDKRQVELGLRGLTHTEVVAGLQAGDWVMAAAATAKAPMVAGRRVRLVAATGTDYGLASRNELPFQLD